MHTCACKHFSSCTCLNATAQAGEWAKNHGCVARVPLPALGIWSAVRRIACAHKVRRHRKTRGSPWTPQVGALLMRGGPWTRGPGAPHRITDCRPRQERRAHMRANPLPNAATFGAHTHTHTASWQRRRCNLHTLSGDSRPCAHCSLSPCSLLPGPLLTGLGALTHGHGPHQASQTAGRVRVQVRGRGAVHGVHEAQRHALAQADGGPHDRGQADGVEGRQVVQHQRKHLRPRGRATRRVGRRGWRLTPGSRTACAAGLAGQHAHGEGRKPKGGQGGHGRLAQQAGQHTHSEERKPERGRGSIQVGVACARQDRAGHTLEGSLDVMRRW